MRDLTEHGAGPDTMSARQRHLEWSAFLNNLCRLDSWKKRAACIGAPSHFFFPEDENEESGRGRRRHVDYTSGKAICATCPVRQQCLEAGLRHGERWGLWGGLTGQELRNLKRRTIRVSA